MKILHIEVTGGVSIELAKAQRRLGHEVTVVDTWKRPLYADSKDVIHNYYDGSIFHKLNCMRKTIKMAKKFDIIHVHTGLPLKRIDYVWMKLFQRKPMVVHYHGGEVRMGYGLHYKWIPNYKIVATPDLLDKVPDAEFIINPMDITLEYVGVSQKDGPLKIGHFPTNPKVKGTDIIMKGLDILKERGIEFELFTTYDRTTDRRTFVLHNDLLKMIEQCDVIVDQIGDPKDSGVPGLFGVISLEAMAMGKVAISNLEDNYREMYPSGNAIVNCSPSAEMLADVLESCSKNRAEMNEIGVTGRKYVVDNYNPDVLAKRYIEIYEELLK